VDSVYRKARGFKKKVGSIQISDDEWSVLLAVDGKKNENDLAAVLQIPIYRIKQILQKLQDMDLINQIDVNRKSKGPAPSNRKTLSTHDSAPTDQSAAEHPAPKEPVAEADLPDIGSTARKEDFNLSETKPESGSRKLSYLFSENLVKIYSKRKVVNRVSLKVRQGEIVGLLGPNGAGKTTTFYMITGLIRPNSGKIFLNEENITQLAMYKRARRGITYLPQEASIFRKLSVEDNLLAIMEATNFPKKEREQRAQQLMEELSIAHIAKNKGYNLSGGERRRTEIARTLVNNPKFILLDEPFAGVDPIAVEDIQNIVIGLKQKNIGVLITDHNVHETLSITDHAYLLYGGKILKEGNSEFLANDPEARKLYLGDKFRLDR
jgi:lipopolysaccharide export system ATP-binding protein